MSGKASGAGKISSPQLAAHSIAVQPNLLTAVHLDHMRHTLCSVSSRVPLGEAASKDGQPVGHGGWGTGDGKLTPSLLETQTSFSCADADVGIGLIMGDLSRVYVKRSSRGATIRARTLHRLASAEKNPRLVRPRRQVQQGAVLEARKGLQHDCGCFIWRQTQPALEHALMQRLFFWLPIGLSPIFSVRTATLAPRALTLVTIPRSILLIPWLHVWAPRKRSLM